MASGCILQKCPVCNEFIWEDDAADCCYLPDIGIFIHPECLELEKQIIEHLKLKKLRFNGGNGMKQYTWSNNKDDELWQYGVFDTKKECIEEAKENYEVKVGDTIAIGITIPFVVNIDAERVLEDLEEQASDECGEASDGWINYEKEEVQKLSDKLTECVNKWLEETKQEPKFYQISDIETVTVN